MPFTYAQARQKWFPSAADGVSVTPSGVAWANSAWVELSSSVAAGLAVCGLTFRTTDTSSIDFEVEVGVGAAGSEVGIGSFKGKINFVLTGLFEPCAISIPLPCVVSAGARLAIRMRKSGTSTTVWRWSLGYVETPITGGLQTTTAVAKCLPSASSLTIGTPGTWTNSAWNQVVASTAAALVITHVMLNSNAEAEVDLGVGGAGAEVVIWTGRHIGGTTGGPWTHALKAMLDNVGAGVRLAVRIRGKNAATNVGVALGYVEKPL